MEPSTDDVTVYFGDEDENDADISSSAMVNPKNFVVVSTMHDKQFVTAAMFAAVEEGNVSALEDLFNTYHLNPDQGNKHSETVAHIAASLGNIDVLKLLVSKGADLTVFDSHGDSTMFWAARQGRHEVIQYLWENGVSVNAPNVQGETPLHIAARYGHRAAVKLLCSFAADINLTDEHGDTALHIAAWHGFPDIMHILCQAGALTHIRNKEGETPLHAAASRGHIESVRCLLDAGAQPHVLDRHGSSSLHLALRRHHSSVALLLLEAAPNQKNAVDKHGMAPIHSASRDGLVDVVKYLCHLKCDVNAPNRGGLYPLHLAARNGHIEICRRLCLAGCKIEQKSRDNMTPELEALSQGHTYIAELLGRLRNEAARDEFVQQLESTTKNPLQRIKIKLFGHSGVGKTTLADTLKCSYLGSWFRRSISGSPAPRKICSPPISSTAGSSRSSTPDTMLSESESSGDICSTRNDSTSDIYSCNTHSNTLVMKLSRSENDVFVFEPGMLAHNYTKGINVEQVNLPGVGDVSLWDFSGVESYRLVYNYFVGNPYCVHLVLFRLSDTLDVQIQQCSFWLTYIQARSPLLDPLRIGGRSSVDIHVALVATHAEVLDYDNNMAEHRERHLLLLMDRLQTRFKHVFKLYPQVFCIDARVAGSPNVKKLKNFLATTRQQILENLPFGSNGFLDKMLLELPQWRATSPSFPVLTWSQFADLVRIQVNPLTAEEHLKKLVEQLQLIGEILYVECAEESLVVLSPSWLCSTILGHVLSRELLQTARSTGRYTADDFQSIFPDTDASDVLQVLECLRLCMENEVEDAIEYFFPCFNRLEAIEAHWSFRGNHKKRLAHLGVHIKPFDSCPRLLAACFPRIQLNIANSTKLLSGDESESKTFETDLYQWLSGSYLKKGLVEGHVSLEGCGDAIEVQIRTTQENISQGFYFMEDILALISDTLEELFPSIHFERHFLSANELNEGSQKPHIYSTNEVMRTLLKDGMNGCIITESGRKENIIDLLGCRHVSNLFVPGTETHASQMSIIARQKLGASLDPPDKFGRDWCLVAVHLGLSDILPKIDPKGTDESCIGRVLNEWTRVSDSTVGKLVHCLDEIGRQDAADVVLGMCPVLKTTTTPRKSTVLPAIYNTSTSTISR